MRTTIPLMLALIAGLAATAPAAAQTPADELRRYEAVARAEDPAWAGFSAERGERFFQSTHGGDWSCATCHLRTPTAAGRHVVTGKAIEPLAPAANPQRFTRADKIEKWFTRNCNDVLRRPCTAREKGDVLAWLLSLGR